MEQQQPSRQFTREEIGEVIELATRLEQGRRGTDPGISYEDLRAIAGELGISDAALLEAVATRLGEAEEEDEQRRAEKRRVAKWREEVRAWKVHLGTYLATLAGLTVIDVAGGDGIDWVYYVAGAWGIAILIHGFTTWSERPTRSDRGS